MKSDYIRLNKLLAEQLGISRREADAYIMTGRVQLNGVVADLGAPVARGIDALTVDNKPIKTTPIKQTYLLLHKPAGYVCSRRQQGETPTIYSLLPLEFQPLKPVGRLDKDSSGLILLTNDGDFAHEMTHPSFHKQKVYYATLNKPLAPLHQQMISDHGIQLEDGNSRLSVSSLADTPEQATYPKNTYRVVMSEGRNRQIRRTFTALGYHVDRLHRTQFGSFSLGSLAEGEFSSAAGLL
ncbi:MAG TPA: pseudouridine synthase [Candidatus Saccharimonadales bacterium]